MSVFVVVHYFRHSLENIIVGLVEKHFVQHVCIVFFSINCINSIFVQLGSSKQCPLLEYGIEDEVRVCITCYDRVKT
jgi:hypothetical protein